MPEPRKHHYLPQFYLRRFSEDGRSVCQIVKEKRAEDQPVSYMTAISDTAAIRDYHALDFEGASDVNLIEKELAQVESVLALIACAPLEAPKLELVS